MHRSIFDIDLNGPTCNAAKLHASPLIIISTNTLVLSLFRLRKYLRQGNGQNKTKTHFSVGNYKCISVSYIL